MQLLDEAREHINRFEFNLAVEKCNQALSENEREFDAYELLLSIFKQIDIDAHKSTLSQYLSVLDQNSDFERFYLYFKEIDEKEKKIELRLLFLKSIWELGRIREFNNECENLISLCIDGKYFNKFESVTKFVEGYSNKHHFLIRSKLIVACERNHVEEILQLLSQYLQKEVYAKSSWAQIDTKHLKSIYSIIEIYRDQSPFLFREYIRFSMLLQMTKELKEKIDLKDILKYIILTDSIEDLFLVLERESHLILEDTLGSYINEVYQGQLSQIPYLFSRTRELFSRKITMAKIENSEEDTTDIFENPLNDKNERSESMHRAFPAKASYKLSQIEEDIIREVKYAEFPEESLSNLVISFIEMELYSTALELLKKLPNSSNSLYLEAQVNLNIGNYSIVVDLVNRSIDEFRLDGASKVPFLYLKARALDELSINDQAKSAVKSL